ncbi:MAG: hypothetical protein AAFR37_20650, partial [Cyanobacteria bacterium J06628_3]
MGLSNIALLLFKTASQGRIYSPRVSESAETTEYLIKHVENQPYSFLFWIIALEIAKSGLEVILRDL